MNRILICLLSILLFTGCKKFLDVRPLDRLSGNAFFQNKEDVESAVWDMYGLMRDKLGSCPFLPASGDMRSGMLRKSAEMGTSRIYFDYISTNDLLTLLTSTSGDVMEGTFHWHNLTTWDGFYHAIQAANIIYYEVGRREIPGVSAADVKQYQAEAVFMRSLAYFIMIRVWGDVPYYTDAYHEDPLPREPMVDVANKCIADLDKVKDDLPWVYADPAYTGVRAGRAAIRALMMQLNMWNAGFDKAHAKDYYTRTAALGEEVVKSGQFELLPIEDFNTLFKGRTKESIFEIVQNSNYGEIIMYQTFSDMVLHFPYKRPASTHHYSFSYFYSEFLQQLYPSGLPDARIDFWFDKDMLSNDGNFQFLKFTNIYAVSDNEDVNPDEDQIIFRYAGLLLLRAEALAEIGQNEEAIRMLNMVRSRAKALPFTDGGNTQALKDAIFAERAKELMGEGQYYYDLIRTGRVMQSQWCANSLTQAQFNARAWTWPLDASVLNQNPYMQLNNYWVR
ncbi:RagB/SusD family nutrient uptake outer membrane protein [Compostibacter hankyongensis]|uniref:RagB/SusD family nutrient uptake outer membrane protein n=1 Tax=Compostibacter hankyongensis TaxID=1007089 RepID=A0ABP8G911_9BACT